MILDNIPKFLRRLSDKFLEGRNRTRIVLGTDRKKERETGYGDGGENDPESGTVDIVAGFVEENPNYKADSSRLYVSSKTNPDDYFGIEKGEKVTGESADVLISDNVYLVGRNRVKIINGEVSIVCNGSKAEIEANEIQIKIGNSTLSIDNNGNINIEGSSLKAKAGSGVMEIDRAGNVSLGSENGLPSRIITENDTCVGANSAGSVTCAFLTPPAVINNNKVKIKI